MVWTSPGFNACLQTSPCVRAPWIWRRTVIIFKLYIIIMSLTKLDGDEVDFKKLRKRVFDECLHISVWPLRNSYIRTCLFNKYVPIYFKSKLITPNETVFHIGRPRTYRKTSIYNFRKIFYIESFPALKLDSCSKPKRIDSFGLLRLHGDTRTAFYLQKCFGPNNFRFPALRREYTVNSRWVDFSQENKRVVWIRRLSTRSGMWFQALYDVLMDIV